jgi:hypothetical protein
MLKVFQNLLIKFKNIPAKTFYLVSFGVFFLLWHYQNSFSRDMFSNNLFSDLDSSWVLGLNWASALHMPWLGNNLVFTYGPLYYLDEWLVTDFHSHLSIILITLGLNLFYTICFTYIYSFFIPLEPENRGRWLPIIAAFLVFIQKPEINLIPIVTAFMFLPIVFPNHNKTQALSRFIRYGIIALLLAIIPFIKFSHFYQSVLFIILMTSFLIYARKYTDGIILVCLFTVFTFLIWVLSTNQGPFSLFPYISSRLAISSGYTETMMVDFTNPNTEQVFILACLLLATLAITWLYLLLTKKWMWVFAWLLPMVTLFLNFKASFVRADSHVFIFTSFLFIVMLYYVYMLEGTNLNIFGQPENTWRLKTAQYLMPFFALITLASFYYGGGKLTPTSELMTIANVFQAQNQNQISKPMLMEHYHLEPEFLNQISKRKSIDIIPWDIAILYGYDLHWNPRPVIQSYASYTSKLDDLDAAFFESANAPSQLIFSLFSIDGRYGIFNNPHTFRVLLDKYQFKTSTLDGRYSLLREKKESIFPDPIEINQREYNSSDDIIIPKIDDGHIFMEVDVEPTLPGKLLDLVYKPTISYIEITLNTGEKIRHRFIRDNAKNGLFVSKYVRTLTELQSVFNEKYTQNIVSVHFIIDTWVYKNSFKVHFYKIPFNP